jgi:hypothetical protein
VIRMRDTLTRFVAATQPFADGGSSARLSQERFPFLEFPAAAQEDLGRHGPPGTKGPTREPHIGLFGGLPPLAQVAGPARGDEIFPGVVPASRAGHHVIDIQLAGRRALPAVLALMRIAEHQVATSEPHGHARRAVVTKQVNHSRHAKLASDDGYGVILGAHWKLSPEVEVVRLSAIVERRGRAPIQENDRPFHGRHLDRNEVAVKSKDGKREDVCHGSCAKRPTKALVQPSARGEHDSPPPALTPLYTPRGTPVDCGFDASADVLASA